MFILEKVDIHLTLPIALPYSILELAWPFWIGIIDISSRCCKLNFGPLREASLNDHFRYKDRCKETMFLPFIQISWNNW